MSFVPEDFTPTWEEWLLSTVQLPNPYLMITDKSGETSFYTGINFTLLLSQVAYAGTDSAAAYRGMHMVRVMPQVFAASALSDAYDHAGGYRVTEDDYTMRQGSRTMNPIVEAFRQTWQRLV